MSDCERIGACPFFADQLGNMMPQLVTLMKREYCHGEWPDCARLHVFKALGRDAVPEDLYPNQQLRARDLIGSGASA